MLVKSQYSLLKRFSWQTSCTYGFHFWQFFKTESFFFLIFQLCQVHILSMTEFQFHQEWWLTYPDTTKQFVKQEKFNKTAKQISPNCNILNSWHNFILNNSKGHMYTMCKIFAFIFFVNGWYFSIHLIITFWQHLSENFLICF